MTDELSHAQLASLRGVAADLRGSDRYDWLVRLAVTYAHADPETRDAKLSDIGVFVKAVAETLGKESGFVLNAAELDAVAGAVALDARAALVLMPIDGGRA